MMIAVLATIIAIMALVLWVGDHTDPGGPWRHL